jgi:hypothetical protein
MADENTQQATVQEEQEPRVIYQGTELKFALDIDIEGFSMDSDDFKVTIKNTKKQIEIKKSDMLVTENDEYLFTVDTAEMGTGDYYLITTAYVPDSDFQDGLRTEVQKQLLCVVTS